VLSIGGDQDIAPIPVGEPANPNLPPSLWIRSVTPGYLKAMHMRLIAGRQFTADDRQGTDLVGILNEYAAERYFPGKDAIGRQLLRGSAPNAPRVTIVGIVATGRADGANAPFKPEIFVPITQRPARGVFVVIEPSRDLAAATRAFAQSIKTSIRSSRSRRCSQSSSASEARLRCRVSMRHSSAFSPAQRFSSPHSGCTASWRIRSRSVSEKSAFAWRLARRPAESSG
jgi:hypothetical protein